MVTVQGLEPERSSFFNTVTACDFWPIGFIPSRLPAVFHSPGVHTSLQESTPRGGEDTSSYLSVVALAGIGR